MRCLAAFIYHHSIPGVDAVVLRARPRHLGSVARRSRSRTRNTRRATHIRPHHPQPTRGRRPRRQRNLAAPPGRSDQPREAARDLDIVGYRITKGTLILWSAHLAGRDPAVWDDPLRYRPDRFIDMTDDQRTAADAAWVPFGGGRRNCIGFALAQMELTLLIARLAQRLDVTPPATGKPGPVGMVVNRPQGGVPFEVSRRS